SVIIKQSSDPTVPFGNTPATVSLTYNQLVVPSRPSPRHQSPRPSNDPAIIARRAKIRQEADEHDKQKKIADEAEEIRLKKKQKLNSANIDLYSSNYPFIKHDDIEEDD